MESSILCQQGHNAIFHSLVYLIGFPSGSVVKNPPVNAGNTGSTPGSGRYPGGGNVNLFHYSCLENQWTEESGKLVFEVTYSQMQIYSINICWSPTIFHALLQDFFFGCALNKKFCSFEKFRFWPSVVGRNFPQEATNSLVYTRVVIIHNGGLFDKVIYFFLRYKDYLAIMMVVFYFPSWQSLNLHS